MYRGSRHPASEWSRYRYPEQGGVPLAATAAESSSPTSPSSTVTLPPPPPAPTPPASLSATPPAMPLELSAASPRTASRQSTPVPSLSNRATPSSTLPASRSRSPRPSDPPRRTYHPRRLHPLASPVADPYRRLFPNPTLATALPPTRAPPFSPPPPPHPPLFSLPALTPQHTSLGLPHSLAPQHSPTTTSAGRALISTELDSTPSFSEGPREPLPFGTEQQNPLGANLQSASASHRPFASAVRLDNPSVSHSWSSAGDSWNDSLHPPSFGSSASQLSSSVDSDIGGAPITPRDARHHKAHGKPFSTGSIYAETDTEDEEDGGIGFDMEMDPVGVLYQSSTMVMDEDEGFSPLNLVTRPPSPIGGGLVGILPLLSQDDGVDTPGSSMQIDSPVRTSPLNDLLLTPTRSGHRSPLSIQPHLLSSQSPHGHTAASAENPVEEEAPEIYMPDSDPLGEQEDGSMASQDSLSEHTPSVVPSPEPPTPISEETGNGLAEMPTISHYHADHDHMLAAIFDPVPSNFFLENLPHSISYPGFFMGPPPITYLPDLLLRPPTIPTAGFSTTADFDSVSVAATYGADPSDEEDEIAQSTNDVVFDDVLSQEMERYNSDFAGFCGQLWNEHALSKMRERGLATTQRPACNNPPPHISAEGAKIMEWAKTRRNEITVEDVEEGEDMQGIQWGKLELSKKAARKWRQARYQNYRNLQVFEKEILPPIKSTREFFSFRRHNALHCRLMHFQLRNVLALSDRNNIFYSTGDQVQSYHPITHTLCDPLLDLSEDALSDPIRISTLGGCGGRDAVLIAGGFNGTYALKALNAPLSDPPITGVLTEHENGITNHIQLVRSRTSATPHAIICSNDNHIRIMDVYDPRYITQHPFDWAINCSASSPDSRLRAVVGDSKDVLIVDADRGRTEFTLTGHRDYGFAAAWSEDGYTIATGNQDQTVRIYDARNLKETVKVFPMRMAGCRTLRFSPIGSGGKRVLVMAEPADLVHVVDAVSWEEAQTITFWGEVGGVEFTPDAEELVVANCDRWVGGIMTFGRKKGVGWYQDGGGGAGEEDDGFVVPSGAGIRLGREEGGRRGRWWNRRGADMAGIYV